MATMVSLKAKQVMACPGSFALIAEAEIWDGDDEVFVCYQSYDTEAYVVADASVFHYMAEDGEEPAPIREEYTSLKEAKATKYGKTFAMLNRLVKKLGAVEE